MTRDEAEKIAVDVYESMGVGQATDELAITRALIRAYGSGSI